MEENINDVNETKRHPLLDVSKKNNKTEEKIPKKEVRIGQKDYQALRKSHYEDVRLKYNKVYLLQHKKYPEKIVELRAASSAHACKMIGWKPNQVRLLSEKEMSEDVVDAIRNEHISSLPAQTSLL